MAGHVEHAEQKIDIADPPPAMERQGSINERWEICCSGSSSHAIKYFAQVSVYFAVLIFSLVNIGLGKNDPIYWGLLSLIIGAMAPAPSLKKERQ